MTSEICNRSSYNVILISESSGCRYIKVLSTIAGNTLVALVTDLSPHLTYDSREHSIQCMPCSSRIINEMAPEIHTMKKNMIFSNL